MNIYIKRGVENKSWYHFNINLMKLGRKTNILAPSNNNIPKLTAITCKTKTIISRCLQNVTKSISLVYLIIQILAIVQKINHNIYKYIQITNQVTTLTKYNMYTTLCVL